MTRREFETIMLELGPRVAEGFWRNFYHPMGVFHLWRNTLAGKGSDE